MSDLKRIPYFLTPQRLTLCAWAGARVLWLQRRLRTPDLVPRQAPASADPAVLLRRRIQSRSLPRLLAELEARAASSRTHYQREALERAHDLWRFLNFLLIRLLRRHDVCLLRGLVLYEFLRGHGVPVAIHCGVQYSAAKLNGHCWISCEGRPLFESWDPADTFPVMFSYPQEEERP